MSDYWHRRLPPAIDDTEALARYNAERARGIMHDPEWIARMEQLQEFFNAQQTRRLTMQEIPTKRRWWWA